MPTRAPPSTTSVADRLKMFQNQQQQDAAKNATNHWRDSLEKRKRKKSEGNAAPRKIAVPTKRRSSDSAVPSSGSTKNLIATSVQQHQTDQTKEKPVVITSLADRMKMFQTQKSPQNDPSRKAGKKLRDSLERIRKNSAAKKEAATAKTAPPKPTTPPPPPPKPKQCQVDEEGEESKLPPPPPLPKKEQPQPTKRKTSVADRWKQMNQKPKMEEKPKSAPRFKPQPRPKPSTPECLKNLQNPKKSEQKPSTSPVSGPKIGRKKSLVDSMKTKMFQTKKEAPKPLPKKEEEPGIKKISSGDKFLKKLKPKLPEKRFETVVNARNSGKKMETHIRRAHKDES